MPDYQGIGLDHVVCRPSTRSELTVVAASLFRIKGFLFEEECLELLADLRRQWEPLTGFVDRLPEHDRAGMRTLCEQGFRYIRVGFDERRMRLREDGLVVGGNGGRETMWWLEGDELILASDPNHITCRLRRRSDGSWEGKWLVHERMPVRLEPRAS